MKAVAITPKPTEIQLVLTHSELAHLILACSVARYAELGAITTSQHDEMVAALRAAMEPLER